MQPPDCVALCTDGTFAPMQVYIVLAITVATFAWLLRPPLLLRLPPKGWLPGALLVFLQCIHLWTYTLLDQRVNTLAHFVVIAFYLAVAAWTVRCVRLRELEQQESDPFDDEFQRGWDDPEFDEEDGNVGATGP